MAIHSEHLQFDQWPKHIEIMQPTTFPFRVLIVVTQSGREQKVFICTQLDQTESTMPKGPIIAARAKERVGQLIGGSDQLGSVH